MKCPGIIAPTRELSVLGFYPNRLENAFKKQYAVVMGQRASLYGMTAADTFLLFKEMYEIPPRSTGGTWSFRGPVRFRDYERQVGPLFGGADEDGAGHLLLHDPKVSFWTSPPSAWTHRPSARSASSSN